MSIESASQPNEAVIEVEDKFKDFVPVEFKDDPFGYFEREGKNIKSGVIKFDQDGLISEDPSATKDLPDWNDSNGVTIGVIGKKVNADKSQVAKTGNPFHEFEVMEIANELGLPTARPIAKVSRGNDYLMVIEKINGLRWTDKDMEAVHRGDLTEEDKENLVHQAQVLMDELKINFDEVGLERKWKLKDMVFDVDFNSKKVIKVIPTDWERTKINKEKLKYARNIKNIV